MIYIESKENNLYKETKKLKDRRGRNKSSKYIIEGFRLIQEAFKAELDIQYIFINNEEEKRIDEYLKDYKDSTKIHSG